ncbi:MAG: hypothetical protein K1X53_09915 [Candidatus Sumerlaeaceae bacterium]|nr:hypothetical protein [Candidatus Sumerlaeaceae bacterium]
MAGAHALLHLIGPTYKFFATLGPRGARRLLMILGVGWMLGGGEVLLRLDHPTPIDLEEITKGEPVPKEAIAVKGLALILTGGVVAAFAIARRPSPALTQAARITVIASYIISVLVTTQGGTHAKPQPMWWLVVPFGIFIGYGLTRYWLRLIRLHATASPPPPQERPDHGWE